MKQYKAGFLPLYVKLYDDHWPFMRERIDKFVDTLAKEIEKQGIDTIAAPVCRIESEFAAAIDLFEAQDVDAIITYHCAYSPSLESAHALANTGKKIIVLDTTETFSFAAAGDDGEILYNHGIHGVQDMCNLLRRNHKDFALEVGHYLHSDVLARVAAHVKAAALVKRMKTSRVGKIGGNFAGMGDFIVSDDAIRDMGIEIVRYDASSCGESIDATAVKRAMEDNARAFDTSALSEETHRLAAQTCLMLRKWIAENNLTAFTMNFAHINKELGLPTVPFLAACKEMAGGIGYAGECDILTAALVGTLLWAYPQTTFTEMFCPDWQNDTIFLSHMGEVNPALLSGKAMLVEKEFVFTDIDNPAVVYGELMSGDATLVNLAPAANGGFKLILSTVKMIEQNLSGFQNNVCGWMKPSMPIAEFLAAYSHLGGTHHCALTYGDVSAEISLFGKGMGWDVHII